MRKQADEVHKQAQANVVVYLRVSTVGQRENTSLRTQFKKIRAYCESRDLKIVGIYKDVESGTKVRKGFDACMERVFHGDADGVAVWSLDRFMRKAVRGWQIIADLDDAGKHLVVVNKDLNTVGPMGKLIRNILLAIADYEIELIRERMQSGIQAKRDAGERFGGQLRYGWALDNGVLVPIPQEIEVLAQVRAMVRSGLKTFTIAKVLNEQGIPTKRGGQWTAKTLERILNARQEINGYSSDVQTSDGSEKDQICLPAREAG